MRIIYNSVAAGWLVRDDAAKTFVRFNTLHEAEQYVIAESQRREVEAS